ncbi:excalibur calcium-binding domain-containing protein [Halopseudomonas oceani]|uniref:Calcium-binding protein n=1 Tax=Halopseudomonas oceani TaxID=1708783 RepID=A0A2P4ER61_9GAMM|nr:excalibur calcium-binding domain-containing protein [Halopseudomonas oceani]POB01094.1 calcium-binding protein [Halopseudomonas oceani]
MKKIILVGLLGFGAWSLYKQSIDTAPSAIHTSSGSGDLRSEAPIHSTHQSFRCDGRQHCSQMTSRAEAEFFTRNCPNTKMDGDRDGIPCENDSRF